MKGGNRKLKIIRKKIIFISIFLLLIIILVVIVLQNKLNKEKYYNITIDNINKEEYNSEIFKEKNENKETCTVDIKGAIKMPGVYQSDCNKYVGDIITLAGGLAENANTKYTNLAKKIIDEMVIIIYTNEEIINLEKSDNFECVCPEIKNDACLTNSSDKNNDGDLININTANISELMKINGIGETRAKAIVEYRNIHGLFKKVEDILNVSGIGEALYEQIKIYITT